MNTLQEFTAHHLYMRYAIDELPDDRAFAMHMHEQYEIYYFVSGNASYLVEGANYPLYPGSILIMQPSESHRVKILGSDRYERYAVNFGISLLDPIDPQHRLLKPFLDRPLGRGNFYSAAEFGDEQMQKFFAEMWQGADDYEKQIALLSELFPLLHLIYKAYTNRGTAEYAPPQNVQEKIVSYVNKHLFDKISVSDLAEHFFLSDSQFTRVFKQATGAAPWEYITMKRLTAAREQLRSGIPAQTVSEQCGFGEYSTFYRAYVKFFGCSPKSDSESIQAV